ncbi:MAG: monovalent cation/H(+) antiporter subunit G [Methyloligellaceae bacterium]
MDAALQWLSWVLIAGGSFVIVVGALGLIRMPDVFTRMHAAGMIDTMGATLLLAGMALTSGFSLVTFKLGVLWLLFFFTSPVAGHALARAALYAGVRPYLAKDDDLKRVPAKYGLFSSGGEEGKS